MAHKLPASVLEAKGAFDKNPQRRRVDPVATGELGDAPGYFDPQHVEIWNELKSQLPVGVAKSADRMIAEVTVRLMAKFRASGLNASELAQLIGCLGRLGMSPADRSKCAVPPETVKEDGEFGEFAN